MTEKEKTRKKVSPKRTGAENTEAGESTAEARRPVVTKAASGAEKTAKGSLAELIKRAQEGEKRGFSQTWDMIISLRNVDLKKPENRFTIDFRLPAGRGKKTNIAFMADALLAKKHADMAMGKEDIEGLGKDRKRLKAIAKGYDFFIAEAPLMPLIGKSLGVVLGTRGKMPMPVPPKTDVVALVGAARNYVRISLRNSPVIQVPIGTEGMSAEDVQKNLEAVYNVVKDRLPKGKNSIRAIFLKLTMGKPVKVVI